MTEKQATFTHVVLKGSPYEVGQFQGKAIQAIPGLADFFISEAPCLPAPDYAKARACFETYCPGLNEELEGLADSLKVPPDRLFYYASTYLRAGGCSHMAVLPTLTADHHVLAGRSYEFSDTMDDMRLCTTHIDGAYAHIGSSSVLIGRGEGLNEHGLCVTHSAGGMPIGASPGMRRPVQDGLQFWALIRTILEQCETVEEAVALIKEVPIGSNPNLILADKGGHAALVEILGPHKGIKVIEVAGAEGYLCSTNHFTLPEMRPHQPAVMRNSYVRHQAIRTCLEEAAPAITKETLRELLATPYPNGLACHFYEEFFGTLRSMVFDLTSGEATVCFGSPIANGWHTFTLADDEAGTYTVSLPQKHADPSFWEPVAK